MGPRGLHLRGTVPQGGHPPRTKCWPPLSSPRAHWRQLWSTNRASASTASSSVAAESSALFPNEAAVIRLGDAVLIDIHDEYVSAEWRYFSEGSMAKLYSERDNDDATVGEFEPAE